MGGLKKIMEKIYKTLSCANLSKTLIVNKNEITIDFLGGSIFPDFKAGRFISGSKDIQKSLEQSSGYGIDYILEKRIVTKKKNISYIDIPEITSKQLCIEWISQNLNKVFSPQDSRDVIKDYLHQKGYIMSNWR